MRIIEEVCPIGIGLHVTMNEEFPKQEFQDQLGDPVSGFLTQIHALVDC